MKLDWIRDQLKKNKIKVILNKELKGDEFGVLGMMRGPEGMLLAFFRPRNRRVDATLNHAILDTLFENRGFALNVAGDVVGYSRYSISELRKGLGTNRKKSQ
jgi:hypothetical protein